MRFGSTLVETDSVLFRFQLAKDSVFTLSICGVSILFLGVFVFEFSLERPSQRQDI